MKPMIGKARNLEFDVDVILIQGLWAARHPADSVSEGGWSMNCCGDPVGCYWLVRLGHPRQFQSLSIPVVDYTVPT
ncbi:hypothetical protein RRG08_022902 [Elysia crispata]|uniref:Uncharacterized protein n=1 Tax=Elysia crispata TaxID=231223 RepID=A0AAE1CJ61_9GAST|nr:hypothetical protein RRG08_022902 [Elysia crispata]